MLPSITPEWRTRLITGGVVLVLLVASFSAGRFSAPTKVETVTVEKHTFSDQFVTKSATIDLSMKSQTRTIYRNVYVAVDGGTSIQEKIVEGEVVKNNVKTDTGSTETKTGTDEKESKKVVTLQPKWRVGVLVGASATKPLLPITGPLVIGVEADYRIIGGVSLGVWGLTSGAVGGSASLEF